MATLRKRPRSSARSFLSCSRAKLDLGDVGGLGALIALLNSELDAVALVEIAVTAHLDSAVVNEHIFTTVVRGREAETFFAVEPFDGAGNTICHCGISPYPNKRTRCRWAKTPQRHIPAKQRARHFLESLSTCILRGQL